MSTGGQGTKRRRNIAEHFNRLSRAHERYRRQTDGRAMTYTFTFAKNSSFIAVNGYAMRWMPVDWSVCHNRDLRHWINRCRHIVAHPSSPTPNNRNVGLSSCKYRSALMAFFLQSTPRSVFTSDYSHEGVVGLRENFWMDQSGRQSDFYLKNSYLSREI